MTRAGAANPTAGASHAAERSLRLRAALARAARFEFWPGWAVYGPIMPWLAWLALRHGGAFVFLACNPAFEAGGGFVGERKSQLLGSSRHPLILPWTLLPAAVETRGEDDRVRESLSRLARAGLRLPCIVKPDVGERGFNVRLARTEADVRGALREVRGGLIAQAYHPGPEECGILWARTPGAPGGRILSVTRKQFPVIVGDGERTLGELIDDHPRFRLQRHVFRARHAARLHTVVGAGERVRLSMSGNHCQGTLFMDGADLVTPELSRVVGDLAESFADGGFDFGRFDVRFESEEKLRSGESLAVVEVNGTSSESTNMYDPEKPLAWSLAVLARQWRVMYELGAWRVRSGARKPTLRDMRDIMRRADIARRARGGSSLAD